MEADTMLQIAKNGVRFVFSALFIGLAAHLVFITAFRCLVYIFPGAALPIETLLTPFRLVITFLMNWLGETNILATIIILLLTGIPLLTLWKLLAKCSCERKCCCVIGFRRFGD